MNTRVLGCVAAMLLVSPAVADTFKTFEMDADYEDVVFNVEIAVTNRGLVIDDISYVGAMLERTREDMGSATELFADARIFSFCSASLSRDVMEARIENIKFCPYNIYIYQQAEPGAPVVVGYWMHEEPTMQPINVLLDDIVAEAAAMN